MRVSIPLSVLVLVVLAALTLWAGYTDAQSWDGGHGDGLWRKDLFRSNNKFKKKMKRMRKNMRKKKVITICPARFQNNLCGICTAAELGLTATFTETDNTNQFCFNLMNAMSGCTCPLGSTAIPPAAFAFGPVCVSGMGSQMNQMVLQDVTGFAFVIPACALVNGGASCSAIAASVDAQVEAVLGMPPDRVATEGTILANGDCLIELAARAPPAFTLPAMLRFCINNGNLVQGLRVSNVCQQQFLIGLSGAPSVTFCLPGLICPDERVKKVKKIVRVIKKIIKKPVFIPPKCPRVCDKKCVHGKCKFKHGKRSKNHDWNSGVWRHHDDKFHFRMKCKCKKGWKGKRCNKPKCRRGCGKHGWCVRPNKCFCKRGFFGRRCTLWVDFRDKKCVKRVRHHKRRRHGKHRRHRHGKHRHHHHDKHRHRHDKDRRHHHDKDRHHHDKDRHEKKEHGHKDDHYGKDSYDKDPYYKSVEKV